MPLSLENVSIITLKPRLGSDLFDIRKEALMICMELDCQVTYEANGRHYSVDPTSLHKAFTERDVKRTKL